MAEDKENDLIGLRSKLSLKETEILQLNKEIKSRDKLVELLQKNKEKAERDLAVVSEKVKNSYTAKELSEYLNQTIEAFNSQENKNNPYANYVINSMDVDLKAQVLHEDGQLRFAAAKLSTDDSNSLSSIKISIRAVPK